MNGDDKQRIPSHYRAEKDSADVDGILRRGAYPRGLTVDFRKLDEVTLQNYIGFYNIQVHTNVTQSELAVAVARHFEMECKSMDEENTIKRFLSDGDGAGVESITFQAMNTYPPPAKRTRKPFAKGKSTDLYGPARPGEQVGAKVSKSDENGSWILATVKKYYPSEDLFEVQDEDDDSKLTKLPPSELMRLDDSVEHMSKGQAVLAVFPDTTSFYRARISKPVKRSSTNYRTSPDIYVQFEDDEDETGRTPHRRVIARYVILDQDQTGGDDSSVNDLEGNEWGEGDTKTVTYSDMIRQALTKLPSQQGNIKDICSMIEEDYSDVLNWKIESDMRKTPVWKSSIRKILVQSQNTNTSRFCTLDENKNIFTLRHENFQ
uniref:SGF29 C-terminal domain-containing protein n=1 Tax=Octactis speculum TaxID=3111310 RepID=A0A7S2D9R3_9STRA|mmetsp:Transcript_458/g.598  ORF Transcript_458/g.598 Transcript_458/m.598 type:complete len:376 (+) Transcript_458:78-1205(+)